MKKIILTIMSSLVLFGFVSCASPAAFVVDYLITEAYENSQEETKEEEEKKTVKDTTLPTVDISQPDISSTTTTTTTTTHTYVPVYDEEDTGSIIIDETKQEKPAYL